MERQNLAEQIAGLAPAEFKLLPRGSGYVAGGQRGEGGEDHEAGAHEVVAERVQEDLVALDALPRQVRHVHLPVFEKTKLLMEKGMERSVLGVELVHGDTLPPERAENIVPEGRVSRRQPRRAVSSARPRLRTNEGEAVRIRGPPPFVACERKAPLPHYPADQEPRGRQ